MKPEFSGRILQILKCKNFMKIILTEAEFFLQNREAKSRDEAISGFSQFCERA